MKKEKILVTGSTGLLGSHLYPYLCSKGYEVIGVSKEQRINSQNLVDFTDQFETYSFLDNTEPTIIINLISLTSVEECESNPERAVKLNVIVVENIVTWINNNKNVHLIQLSTDHVYDGVGYKTEANINITNKYAETKFAGERVAEKVNSTILRTNFVGKSKSFHRESMTDWLYKSLKNKQEIKVLSDVFFNPLSISYLIYIIEKLICIRLCGVYNLGSKNGMSKADFDYKFAKALQLPISNIKRITTKKANFLKAYRPKDMRMDSDKFEKETGIMLPCLSDVILQVVGEYENNI